MILLAGIQLPNELTWSDRYAWSPIAQQVKTTLGGLTIPYSGRLLNGRPITLVAEDNMGWISESIKNDLELLAEDMNGPMPLIIHSFFSGNVIFRHNDPPALDLHYLVNGSEPSEWLAGTIKLLTI